MSELVRFSVSIEKELLERFDRHTDKDGYPTRSKAITDLVRDSLVKHEWKEGKEVAAAIIIVYDHHKRDLSNRLTHIQHEYHEMVISSQHIHLDHDNCLEIIVVKGGPKEVIELSNRLKATKGVKFGSLSAASTGKEL
jgi:CopG family nickel-responsive transcriptional regulator